jgi:hypothetical protein
MPVLLLPGAILDIVEYDGIEARCEATITYFVA